jgi:hypothetical protein
MLPDKNRPRPLVNIRDKKDLVINPFCCPHHLLQLKEIWDDLPTILCHKKPSNYKNLKLILSAFETKEEIEWTSGEFEVYFAVSNIWIDDSLVNILHYHAVDTMCREMRRISHYTLDLALLNSEKYRL